MGRVGRAASKPQDFLCLLCNTFILHETQGFFSIHEYLDFSTGFDSVCPKVFIHWLGPQLVQLRWRDFYFLLMARAQLPGAGLQG